MIIQNWQKYFLEYLWDIRNATRPFVYWRWYIVTAVKRYYLLILIANLMLLTPNIFKLMGRPQKITECFIFKCSWEQLLRQVKSLSKKLIHRSHVLVYCNSLYKLNDLNPIGSLRTNRIQLGPKNLSQTHVILENYRLVIHC